MPTKQRRPGRPGGASPISPKRKWQAITVATLVLVPAFWAMLVGVVGSAVDDTDDAPNAAAALALGLSLIPFVFIVLAFVSQHPRAPAASAKAMGLCLLVGITVSALAADGVSGIVAGVGAGGIVALRPEPDHGWRPRAVGVLVATVYTLVLVRAASTLVLLPAPVFPLTALGLADHYVDWKRERDLAQPASRSVNP